MLLQYDDMALQACIVDSALVSHSNFDPFLISCRLILDIMITRTCLHDNKVKNTEKNHTDTEFTEFYANL